MALPQKHPSAVSRYYIDTRPLVPSTPKQPYSLPLLELLTFADQEAVTRFLRPADKYMSLASALLKYTFIHRQAKIPWSKVVISRTPVPHRRPYWQPPADWNSNADSNSNSRADEKGGLEFNVTHQAGMVVIIGCTTPTPQLPTSTTSTTSPLSPSIDISLLDLTGHRTPDLEHSPFQVRVGIDIACADEDKRTPQDMTTQAKFDEWVDIFAEMFSERERRDMRHAPVHIPVAEREEGAAWDSSSSSSDGGSSEAARLKRARENEAKVTQLKLRRFYAYWALKEAYIKMVGEGLLASWLKELEFLDVTAPASPLGDSPSSSSRGSKSHSRSRSRGGGGRGHNRAYSHSHHNSHHHHHHHHSSTISGLNLDPEAEEAAKWTHPSKAEGGMQTLLRGRKLDDVDIELVAYEEDFMVATALRGVEEVFDDGSGGDKGKGKGKENLVENRTAVVNGVVNGNVAVGVGVGVVQPELNKPERKRFIRLDIERDIRPCAEGRCRCLD